MATYTLYQVVKFVILSALIFILTLSLTGCGLKLSDSVVIGSRSFLEEVNNGRFVKEQDFPMDLHTEKEKKQLADLVRVK